MKWSLGCVARTVLQPRAVSPGRWLIVMVDSNKAYRQSFTTSSSYASAVRIKCLPQLLGNNGRWSE